MTRILHMYAWFGQPSCKINRKICNLLPNIIHFCIWKLFKVIIGIWSTHELLIVLVVARNHVDGWLHFQSLPRAYTKKHSR